MRFHEGWNRPSAPVRDRWWNLQDYLHRKRQADSRERRAHSSPTLMARAGLLTADVSGLDSVAQAGVWIPSNNLHTRKGKHQHDFLWHFPLSSFSIIIVRNSRKKNTELSITYIPPGMRIGCVRFGLMIKVLGYPVTWQPRKGHRNSMPTLPSLGGQCAQHRDIKGQTTNHSLAWIFLTGSWDGQERQGLASAELEC